MTIKKEYNKLMHWQRLDRETSLKVIDSVKSDENASMFSHTTSEVKLARLSFYKDYSLYRVTNFASLPSFTFEFLSDGKFFHYLDGTETSIHTVNDKGQLALNKSNVVEYLEFYFAQVGSDDGDVIVVTNPHDMPLLDSLEADAYNAVFENFKAPEVHYDSDYEMYEVDADLYVESHIIRTKIQVSAKGRIKIKAQKKGAQQVMVSAGAETAI